MQQTDLLNSHVFDIRDIFVGNNAYTDDAVLLLNCKKMLDTCCSYDIKITFFLNPASLSFRHRPLKTNDFFIYRLVTAPTLSAFQCLFNVLRKFSRKNNVIWVSPPWMV